MNTESERPTPAAAALTAATSAPEPSREATAWVSALIARAEPSEVLSVLRATRARAERDGAYDLANAANQAVKAHRAPPTSPDVGVGGRWDAAPVDTATPAPPPATITAGRWHDLTALAYEAGREAHFDMTGRDDAGMWADVTVHGRTIWLAATRALLADLGVAIDVDRWDR